MRRVLCRECTQSSRSCNCLAALAPLLLYALFVLLEGVRSLAALLTISQMVFPVLALMAGLMGGYQFPLASRIYFAAAPPRTPSVEEGA